MTVPGSTSGWNRCVGRSSSDEQRRRPRSPLRVDHLRRGRDGVLGRQPAGEPVVQQIGNRDERGRGPQEVRRRSLRRIELKQGIEVQELNAGGGVDAFGRDLPEDLRRHIVAARIAIVIRVLEQLALLAEERVVASPGIEADARERDVGDVLEALLHFVPEAQDVPVQRAIRAHGDVGKTPDVLERQDIAVEPSEDRSSALGAEIQGQKPCAHGATAYAARARNCQPNGVARSDTATVAAAAQPDVGSAAIFQRNHGRDWRGRGQMALGGHFALRNHRPTRGPAAVAARARAAASVTGL